MRVVTNHLDSVPLLHVFGEVDHGSAPVLSQAIGTALDDGGVRILLDLGSCPYMDSGGVSLMLETLRRVKNEGWLGIIAPHADVHRILALVGLMADPGFRVFETSDDAERAVARAARDECRDGDGLRVDMRKVSR